MGGLDNVIDGIQQSLGIQSLIGLLAVAAVFIAWSIVRVTKRKPNGDVKDEAMPKQPVRDFAPPSAEPPQPSVAPRPAPAPAQVAQPTAAAEAALAPAKPVFVQSVASEIPQDSVLRRHYLAARQAEQEARANPYPSDSVLRRHYDTTHRLILETPAIAEKSVLESPKLDPTPAKAESRPVKTGRPSIEAAMEKKAGGSVRVNGANQASLPEDSILRRHFVSQLQAEIERQLPPRPSDSVLRRHFEHLLQSELENRLAAFNG